MAARKKAPEKVSLRDGFDTAVAAAAHLDPQGIHAGAVAAGRMIAQQIDTVVNDDETPVGDKTKTMYLVPHVMGIMRELLLTPSSRLQAKQPVRGTTPAEQDGDDALEELEKGTEHRGPRLVS